MSVPRQRLILGERLPAGACETEGLGEGLAATGGAAAAAGCWVLAGVA